MYKYIIYNLKKKLLIYLFIINLIIGILNGILEFTSTYPNMSIEKFIIIRISAILIMYFISCLIVILFFIIKYFFKKNT